MKKTMVLVALLCLLAVFGAKAGVISLLSPARVATLTTTVVALSPVDQGKSALQNHDILSARNYFQQAVTANPADQEANLLLGVTRVFALFEQGSFSNSSGLTSIRKTLELAGFSFQTFGLYGTESTAPDKLASSTPRTGAVLDMIRTDIMPEVKAAIDNLSQVSDTSFSSVISPAAYAKTGNDIAIDYADALVLKALLNAVYCNLNLMMVYGLDVSIPDIQAAPKELLTYKSLLSSDPTLLGLNDASRITTAKGALIGFIDTYTAAVPYLKAAGRGAGHLFVVDLPVTDEPVQTSSADLDSIASTLATVKASLSGPQTFSGKALTQDRTVDLSKFFDAANPILPRSLLANCATNVAPADATMGGLFPQGLSSYSKLAAQNGYDLLGVACSNNSGYPKIAVDPGYFLSLSDYQGYSSGPMAVTINNFGTGALNVSSIALTGANSGGLTLSKGTCSSLTPIVLAGQSCAVTVDLKRPVAGPGGSGSLQILSDDKISPTVNVPLFTSLSPTTGGAISGLVTDAKTAAGLQGVTVSLYNAGTNAYIRSTSSNATGGYAFNELSAGTYKLFFSAGSLGGAYQSKWFDGKFGVANASQVSVATSTSYVTVNMSLIPTPVTLSWGSVWRHVKANGSQVDVLDAGINSNAVLLDGMTLKVDGPNGFSYTFTEADKIPFLNGRFSLYKEYASLAAGVYTFTLTDANGNVSYRVASRGATPKVIPMVDASTVQFQRKADGSYRVSWAPVNDVRTYHYRVRISKNDSATTPVYYSVRNPVSFVDIPQGSGVGNPLTDGAPYKVRIEVMDAPVVDLITTRTDTAWLDFTPQPADYNPKRVLVNQVMMDNRTDANNSFYSEIDLQVSNPAAVSAVDLRTSTGTPVYSFDLVKDRSSQEFWKKITPALSPGSYILHFVANGLDHYAYLTLTTPVSYPKVDPATMQVEDQGNNTLRFSWANVDHAGPLYYRVVVWDTVTGPVTNGGMFSSNRSNLNYVDVPKNSLGDLSTKQWRVEVTDSAYGTTIRNRVNGGGLSGASWMDIPSTLKAWDPARPAITSWRVRSMTSSANVTRSQVLVGVSTPKSTLAQLTVTGPGGYSRNLLVSGRYSPYYGGYALEEPGAPAEGLYTITATDNLGKSAVRYITMPAVHPVPPVDYHSFRTNLEPNGDMRVSWAPVVSDVPVWYQLAVLNSADANGDGLLDGNVTNPTVGVDINADGTSEQVGLYPAASVTVSGSAVLPPSLMFRVSALDGGQSYLNIAGVQTVTTNLVSNASQSAAVPGEPLGFNFASLTDADNDGYTSGLDANDADPAVYPFALGNDALPVSVRSTNPASGATSVSPSAGICANFDKVIDPTTLAGNFTVSGAAGSLSFSIASATASYASTACFIPSAPLAAATSFTANLSTGVKDPAGNALAAPYTWSFSTPGTPVTGATPAAGSYPEPQSVTLAANSGSATIYYTTDGSTPTYPVSGTTKVYSAPIAISGTTTLNYFARDAALGSETPHASVYTITVPVAPGLVAAADAGKVDLSWSAPAGATSYNVYLTGVSASLTATGSVLHDAMSSGFGGLESIGSMSTAAGNALFYEQSTITLDTIGNLGETYQYWDNLSQTWTSTAPAGYSPNDSHLLLTAGGAWQLETSDLPSVSFNGDGSAIFTDQADLSQRLATVSVVELAGLSIASAFDQSVPMLPGALVFPAGARRYDMTQTQVTESYRTNNNSAPTWYSSVGQLPWYFASSSTPVYLDSDSGSYQYYAVLNPSSNSAALYQRNTVTQVQTGIGTGAWDIRTVNGQELLVVTVPPALRASYKLGADPFFAVINGVMTAGDHFPAGYTKTGQMFNQATLAHLRANLSPAASAGPVPPIAQTTATTLAPAGLFPNLTYTFQVTAVNGTGESARSNQASATPIVAGSADTSAPTVSSFTLQAVGNNLAVPITALSASDNLAISGYYLSELSGAPSPGAAGWLAATPTSYKFASAGSKTLYLWAKDVAGNVSSVKTATTVIDQTAPSVTFSIPATSSSLTVSLTLSATDPGSAVAGYLVSESSSTPTLTDKGWSSSAPTSFAFASQGPHTLYAYVKDAAGNIAAQSRGVTISLSSTLTVQDMGTGSGTVTSAPAGISCITGSSAGCSSVWTNGSPVTLSAVASANSTFTGWGGVTACSGTGNCYLNITAPTTVAATFTKNPALARIDGSSVYYYTLGTPLDFASASVFTLRAQNHVFTENVIKDSSAAILLVGGYNDSLFSLRDAANATVIDGTLKIRNGTVRVDGLKVR